MVYLMAFLADRTGNNFTGAAALTALYRKEGHRITGKELEGVPLVGGWLAKQVKSWKREPPRVMASKAALARSQVRCQSKPPSHMDYSVHGCYPILQTPLLIMLDF